MKLVDEKGKLFGKINLVDLVVLILLAGVICVVAFKVFGDDRQEDAVKITYTAMATAVAPETYASLQEHIPSTLMAGGGLLDGRVIAAESKPCVVYTQSADGRLIKTEDPRLVNVLFTIEAYVHNTITNEVGTQEVRIGKNHTIKTTYFEFSGTILTVTWEP